MIKVRITAEPEQVETLIANLEEFSGLEIFNVSREYKQTRYNKNSKLVSVYVDIKDYDLNWRKENNYGKL